MNEDAESLCSSRSDDTDEDDDDDEEEEEEEDEREIDGDETISEEERLTRFFAHRQKLLGRIASSGKSASYIRMLRENEELVKREAMRMVRENKVRENEFAKDDDEDDKNNNNRKQSWRPTMTSRFRSFVTFESHHSLPAFACLSCYCVAHLAAYETIHGILSELTRNVNQQDAFFLGLLVVAGVFLRLTGGLWDWLDDDRYRGVKYDVHNRLILGSWDTRIHQWFRTRLKAAGVILNLLAIYFCFIAISHFQHSLLGLLDCRQDILAGLPSRGHKVVDTHVVEKLEPPLSYTAPACDREQWCNKNQMLEHLSAADETYLYSQVSISSYYSLMGYSGAQAVRPLAMILYYFTSATLALVALNCLGYKML